MVAEEMAKRAHAEKALAESDMKVKYEHWPIECNAYILHILAINQSKGHLSFANFPFKEH